ncbi:MAG TPA: amidohydrolase family protein [Candidatus Dormibacteraeota bacterium]|jgi:imidazolonepropionase-like amidohydrolase|nr:amidohydrolase family protein [Candidatus Dormibacteraeota bacterium]
MPEAAPRFTLITADRLIDGSGAPPVPRGAILLEGDRIVSVGTEAEVRAPSGAAVDRQAYAGGTILPGLVDAHTHLVAPGDGTLGDDIAREDDDLLLLQAAKNARTLLHSGVTTLRENGAKGKVAFSLREGIRRRLAPGPRMVICGRPIAITGGHMGYFGSEADGEIAVRAEVRKLIKEGADYIKIVASGGSTRTSDPNRASYTVAELAAMTDEARRHGKLTAAHCTSAQSIQNCLDAGVDMIIHCIFTEPDGTFRFRPDLVERLAAARAWVNPTLYVMKAGIERMREAREREGRLTPELVAQIERSRRALDVRVDAVRRMSEAGVRMTAGSDSPWGWYAPGEFVHEIHMLAQAGLSYGDAVVAGTAGAADSIGVGGVSGRLLPGRQADVLIVRGDPTREITALWDVLDVYQAGRRIARSVT